MSFADVQSKITFKGTLSPADEAKILAALRAIHEGSPKAKNMLDYSEPLVIEAAD